MGMFVGYRTLVPGTVHSYQVPECKNVYSNDSADKSGSCDFIRGNAEWDVFGVSSSGETRLPRQYAPLVVRVQ